MSLGGGGGGTPAPTTDEKELARKAALEWNDYVERYTPLEDKMIELATPRPGDVERLRGEANAVAAAGLSKDFQATAAKRLARGASPAGLGAAIGELSDAQGQAAGAGLSKAEAAVKDRELKTKTKLTAYGRGLQDQSMLGLSRAAQDSTRLAIESFKAKQKEKDARMEALGTALGVAASYGLDKWSKRKALSKARADAGHKAWVDSGYGWGTDTTYYPEGTDSWGGV